MLPSSGLFFSGSSFQSLGGERKVLRALAGAELVHMYEVIGEIYVTFTTWYHVTLSSHAGH